MTPSYLNIAKAAAAAGVTPKMVRHYEALGLIPEVDRTEAGYRLYGEREIGMLRFIRQCRGLGFSMAQVQDLLRLWTDEGRQSRAVKMLARRQLEELELRQRELDRMQATLSDLVERCAGDEAPHCAILDRLQSAGSTSPPTPAARAATLEQVAPGTRRAARPRAARPPEPQGAALALMAWSHAAASAA